MGSDGLNLAELGGVIAVLAAVVGWLNWKIWKRDKAADARKSAIEALYTAYMGYGTGWEFQFHVAQEAVSEFVSLLPASVSREAPPPLESRDDLKAWLEFAIKKTQDQS